MIEKRPSVLIIAGSDSAGLAGLQADNRALNALGVHSLNIVSATTAQNNRQVLGINPVPIEVFSQQWQAIQAFDFEFIKIGLIPSAEQIKFILEHKTEQQKIVWDPVINATSRDTLVDTADNLLDLQQQLLSRSHCVTPNIEEAHHLLGQQTHSIKESYSEPVELAEALLTLGCSSILITGGPQNDHDDTQSCNDYFATRDWFHREVDQAGFWLNSPAIKTNNTRGTGCTLAASITGYLALGYSLEDSVVLGKAAINSGLENSFFIDSASTGQHEKGGLQTTGIPLSKDLIPKVNFSQSNVSKALEAFPPCTLPSGNAKPLGLYPVVDRAEWLSRLLPLGVDTIQLRIKDLTDEALKIEIAKGISIAKAHSARLFINDHWQLAIELGAYGVHLGQQDLDYLLRQPEPLQQLRQAGLRLGISTHCHYEVARTLPLQPSYIACGPVFATTTKDMPWIPHGIENLLYWNKLLSDFPLVAIGGINETRIDSIIETGVEGIAMITAITNAPDPEKTTKLFLNKIEQARQVL